MTTGELPSGGLSRGVVGADYTLVPKARWEQLAGTKAVVGSCRSCGGPLRPIPSGDHDAGGLAGEITWYEAVCGLCGKEVAAPNGRVFARSSAHGETPAEFLTRRAQADKESRPGYRPEDEGRPRRRSDRT